MVNIIKRACPTASQTCFNTNLFCGSETNFVYKLYELSAFFMLSDNILNSNNAQYIFDCCWLRPNFLP